MLRTLKSPQSPMVWATTGFSFIAILLNKILRGRRRYVSGLLEVSQVTFLFTNAWTLLPLPPLASAFLLMSHPYGLSILPCFLLLPDFGPMTWRCWDAILSYLSADLLLVGDFGSHCSTECEKWSICLGKARLTFAGKGSLCKIPFILEPWTWKLILMFYQTIGQLILFHKNYLKKKDVFSTF